MSEIRDWEARDGGATWGPAPEGGILSQAFVAAVVGAIGDPMMRRWVFIRWQGASAAEIAGHFGRTRSEVRAALDAAAEMLRAHYDALLEVLIAEERDVLACLRNRMPSGGPEPATRYATWKEDLKPGETSRTPAHPRVREDTPETAAADRLAWLLRALAE